jgi:putative flavoprotein involved in K+ transport
VERVDVAVIGGGQAGLAASHHLERRGVDHVVLERRRVGETWRRRWDSFCLVTPNWTMDLPGHPYTGGDPDGFAPRDEIVAYLEGYASTLEVPVRTGCDVRSVERPRKDGFVVRTSGSDLHARALVLATGAYQKPHRPPGADTLPADILAIDVEGYTNPQALPDGTVLIVGSGQSGCQLAEELHEAGREVLLSCGRAPWAPRRIGGRDIVWWAVKDGFLDQRVEDLPVPEARLFANVLATGHGGGHDLHLRTLRAAGVELAGHFLGADGHRARFADDLLDSVAWGDQRFHMLVDDLPALAGRLGLPIPEIPHPEPFGPGGPTEVDLTGFGAAIFTSGFRPDYGALAPWPEAFDDLGFPIQRDGSSLVVPSLYFLGVHFLRTRKSSLMLGVGEDAEIVADSIRSALW